MRWKRKQKEMERKTYSFGFWRFEILMGFVVDGI
jgi:Co/Zn/Cd efflux system component